MTSGRPTKLNADTSKAIIDALAFGCTRKDAAESAGVSYASLILWMNTGSTQTRGNFYKFFKAVTKAEAEARKKFTSTIASAAKDGDWRAAETFLKRRDPENWGDRQRIDVGPTDDEITAAIERELARVAASGKAKDAGAAEVASSGGDAAPL